MTSDGCLERVSRLFSDSASFEHILGVFNDLLDVLNRINFKSDLEIVSLLEQEKISRCLEAEWCLPRKVSGEFVPIR